jgi:Rap1a immunity proteins
MRGNIMRAYIVAASLALSAIGTASATVVDTGADAQKYCRALVEGSFSDSDEARSAGACEGMIETATIFSPNLPAELRACPPAQGSTLASVKVLLQYLDRNPDRLSEAGITLAIEALRDAWPCDGDDTAATARSGPKPKKHAAKKPKQ